jgi:2-iminobutanoate/2-iminopropanoate deaminase
MSSVIGPSNPGTRDVPESLAAQVTNLFTHLRAAITAAGGTPDDIIKIEFWAKDLAGGREALNVEWVKMFPDPDARPARHTQPLPADSRAQVQCAFTAVLS